jgi:hypothetical protein
MSTNERTAVAFVLSAVLAFIFISITDYAFTAIFAAIPFALVSWRRALLLGAIAGFAVPMGLYLAYPSSMISRLSSVLSSITGFPALLILLLFPLIYCAILATSAPLWSYSASFARGD